LKVFDLLNWLYLICLYLIVLCFVGEKREVCFVGGPNKPLRKVVIDVGEGESWCEGLAYVAVSREMSIDTFALDPMRPTKRWMDIGKSAGGKRTQKWLRLLELVAAVQHLERCATHSTACRVCQDIKKGGGGAHADPVLQSLLQSKDSKLHTH
jgi:hypothetical protein